MKRLSQEEAKERFKSNGLDLLSEYNGYTVKVKVRCACGREFYPLPYHVFQDSVMSCGKCSRMLKVEDVLQRLQKTGIELLSDYGGVEEVVRLRCFCGKEFKAVLGHVIYGHTKSCLLYT